MLFHNILICVSCAFVVLIATFFIFLTGIKFTEILFEKSKLSYEMAVTVAGSVSVLVISVFIGILMTILK